MVNPNCCDTCALVAERIRFGETNIENTAKYGSEIEHTAAKDEYLLLLKLFTDVGKP